MQVLKYQLNVGMNVIRQQGAHKLQYLNYQDNKLMGWFTFTTDNDSDATEYEVYVALTGERVPDNYNYVTSTQLTTAGGYFVVHAFD